MATNVITHFTNKPKSIVKRIEAGKALGENHPIVQRGEYTPSAKRVDPVAILEKPGKTRLQDLVPIGYACIVASPFAFLRGAAAIMAAQSGESGDSRGIIIYSKMISLI